MARINVDIGARLAASFTSTLSRAKASVSALAGELSAPFLKVSQGASVTGVALDHVKEKIVSGVLGPVGALAYGIGAVNVAMWALNKASNAVAGGLAKFQTIEDLEGAFRPLLGSLVAARSRLADLASFANKTPFNLPEVAQASRLLQVLTRGALATGEGLRLVGDTAAASGASFNELAMWIGRAYDGLQSGRPIGEAAMRLQELGVLSGTARSQIEALQKAGKAGNEVWAVLRKELDRNKGAMEVLATTVTGLRSTLQDAKDTLYREFGKSFADYEKETIKGTTEVLEKMIPVAEHAGQVLNDLGVADSPGEWFPVFDVQLKKMMASALSATEFLKGLINTAVIAGSALGSMVIAATLASLLAFAKATYANMVATRAWIAAQQLQNITWTLNLASIRANIAAYAGHLVAQGRSTVSAYLQAGAMIVLRAAIDSVTASLRALAVALFLNPWTVIIGLIASAAAGMYFYAKSVDDAAKHQAALRDETDQLQLSLARQRKDMQTVTDKVKLLATAYDELRKAQEAAANAAPEDRPALDARVAAIQAQIAKAEKTDDGTLKASEDRARLEKELADLIKEARQAEMTGEQKLIELMAEKNKLLEEQKTLQENLQSAEYEQQQIPRLDKEITQKQLALQQQVATSDAAKVALAKAQADSDWLPGQTEKVDSAQGAFDASQAREKKLRSEIAALQSRKAGITPAAEAARSALAGKDVEVEKSKQAEDALKKKLAAEAEAKRDRLDELAAEAQILQLKSTGAQRLADELAIRRKIMEWQYLQATHAGDEVKQREIQLKYWQEIYKVQTAIAASRKGLTEAQKDRRESMQKALFDRLSPEEKSKVLTGQRKSAMDEATALDLQAKKARAGGREAEANELATKAEQARARGDQLGWQILDLQKSAAAKPTTDSLRRIGGGGLVSGMGKDPALAIREKEVKAVEKLTTQIEALNKNLRDNPRDNTARFS